MAQVRIVTGRPGFLFRKNNRLKRGRLLFADGSEREVGFVDTDEMQTAPIDPPVTAKAVRIVLVEVYTGSVYKDHDILGEVEIWGSPK